MPGKRVSFNVEDRLRRWRPPVSGWSSHALVGHGLLSLVLPDDGYLMLINVLYPLPNSWTLNLIFAESSTFHDCGYQALFIPSIAPKQGSRLWSPASEMTFNVNMEFLNEIATAYLCIDHMVQQDSSRILYWNQSCKLEFGVEKLLSNHARPASLDEMEREKFKEVWALRGKSGKCLFRETP